MIGPFDLVTRLTVVAAGRAEATWRPTGTELGGRVPATLSRVLIVEAMTQCAGRVLCASDGGPEPGWMLAGVDRAEASDYAVGDAITLVCTVRRRSATAATVSASARRGDEVIGRAILLMVRRPTAV